MLTGIPRDENTDQVSLFGILFASANGYSTCSEVSFGLETFLFYSLNLTVVFNSALFS